MESWQQVWRMGFAPLLSNEGLEALQGALQRDDRRLLQGATTVPHPLHCVQDWPVEAACALGFCGWQGGGLKTVAEVEALTQQGWELIRELEGRRAEAEFQERVTREVEAVTPERKAA